MRSLATAGVFALCFCAVALGHWTLLRLPYFWDEGGYYVPAAYDFYRFGALVPTFTNAHPPLPNVVLGTLWHIFGFRVVVTRLAACAFAAGGLTATFVLGKRFLGTPGAWALLCLTALYPIWFAQSSLAHADIFAACFTLAGLAAYLTAPEQAGPEGIASSGRRLGMAACFFALSVLAKETAIVQPAMLAGAELWYAARSYRDPQRRRAHLHWFASLSAALPPLVLWYLFHYAKTSTVFGNPVYLRYNATANFTVAHVLRALCYRFVHLFWQRNIWVAVLLALGCLALPCRLPPAGPRRLRPRVIAAIGLLVLGNWVAFSVLGGALLTRYLLPIYPLILLACVAAWRERTQHWPWLVALTGVAFTSAIWVNPAAFFAPEDNLTYRDMIVVHREAIDLLQAHYPQAAVLTAWPAAAELSRPELGYAAHPFKVWSIEDFSRSELSRAADQPGSYDTALVFTTHYATPAFRKFLITHADSWRARHTAGQLDLLPPEIAQILGGRVVWEDDRNGEWAAILRFDRSYDASLSMTTQGRAGAAPPLSAVLDSSDTNGLR